MMKNGQLVCLSLCVIFLLSGCAAGNAALIRRQMERTNTIAGTADGVEEFAALNTGDNEYDTCYNITPEYIAAYSDYRVFKYNSSCASYLYYADDVYPMGDYFGGLGVTDMKLADMNGDSAMELYFTFSFGSGIHRSMAGMFDPAAKAVTVYGFACWGKDMMIVSDEKGKLSLYEANLSLAPNSNGYAHFTIEADNYITDIADIVHVDNEVYMPQL